MMGLRSIPKYAAVSIASDGLDVPLNILNLWCPFPLLPFIVLNPYCRRATLPKCAKPVGHGGSPGAGPSTGLAGLVGCWGISGGVRAVEDEAVALLTKS